MIMAASSARERAGALPFLPENQTPLIATGSHMIGTARNFQSQSSGHHGITILSNPNVKIPDATVPLLHLAASAFTKHQRSALKYESKSREAVLLQLPTAIE